MQNIFSTSTINEFKTRIENLNPSAEAKWGKMNVYQMLKHCTENERMMVREKDYPRRFIGRIFGKMALKANTKDAKPLDKNGPTHPELIFTDNGDVEAQKQEWIALLEKYPLLDESAYSDFVHPFFGKMTSEQISTFAYKHVDHHLRQFGA